MANLDGKTIEAAMKIIGNSNYKEYNYLSEALINFIDECSEGSRVDVLELIIIKWKSDDIVENCVDIAESCSVSPEEFDIIASEWKDCIYGEVDRLIKNHSSVSEVAERFDLIINKAEDLNRKERIVILALVLRSKMCPYNFLRSEVRFPEEEFSDL